MSASDGGVVDEVQAALHRSMAARVSIGRGRPDILPILAGAAPFASALDSRLRNFDRFIAESGREASRYTRPRRAVCGTPLEVCDALGEWLCRNGRRRRHCTPASCRANRGGM